LTDHAHIRDAPVTITVSAGSTYAEAVSGVLDTMPGSGPVLILPASLRRTDPLASAVRQELRASQVASHLMLPLNPAATLIGRATRSPSGAWIDAEIRAPDVPATSIRIPARLNGPEAIWTVTDVDAIGGTGPYMLDLVTRYAHPRTRLRQLASRRRSDAVVDVNLVVRPSRCVVGKAFGETVVVGVVNDPIAAELFALALADEDLAPGRSVTGPWEDRVVQRATELEIGVQIPQHLSIDLVTTPGTAVRTVLERVLARIGVEIA